MLSTGQLAFNINYGGSSYSTVVPMTLTDGVWYEVSIIRSLREASLVIDGGVATADAISSSITKDAWIQLFESPQLGVILGQDIGPPLFGISRDVCARRCIDEDKCLSFDFVPSRIVQGFIHSSVCSLKRSTSMNAPGGLIPAPDSLHYSLKSATGTLSATVSVGRFDDVPVNSKNSNDNICDSCFGNFFLNDVFADLKMLSGNPNLSRCEE